MLSLAKEVGLREPDFIQEEDFKAIVYRVSIDHAQKDYLESTPQVEQLMRMIEGEK